MIMQQFHHHELARCVVEAGECAILQGLKDLGFEVNDRALMVIDIVAVTIIRCSNVTSVSFEHLFPPLLGLFAPVLCQCVLWRRIGPRLGPRESRIGVLRSGVADEVS